MTSVHVPQEKMKYSLLDLATGNIVKPGDGKGHPDEAFEVQITISKTEEKINDLLEAIVGLQNAAARMLGIKDRNTVVKRYAGKQSDLDMVADNFHVEFKKRALDALYHSRRAKEPEPVFRDARTMLAQCVQMLNRIDPKRDSGPSMLLATHFSLCCYQLISSRSNDDDRTAALAKWRGALQEVERARKA